MSGKIFLDVDVMTAARQRINRVFDDFEHVYVAFSGGKDSSALLQLTIEIARERGRLPLDVMILDLEAQYQSTVDFVRRMADNPDVRMYWVCLPIHLRNAVSQIQPHWVCWHPDAQDRWVRTMPDHPSVISDESFFPFFHRGMEFEEFVPAFGEWYAAQHGGNAACMVAIRSTESLNRYRTIKSETKTTWQGFGWTTLTTPNVYNCYPIYDWTVEDVWAAHGKHGWDYSKVYDLMYLAGLSIHQMRLCQPYGDDQRKGLWLYKILEPETWSKVVGRVEGANFGNRYVELTGNVLGNIKITLPEGHTWKSYAKYLLSTMPPYLEEHYRKKIFKFLNWWRKNGRKQGFARIPDAADAKLEANRKAPSWRRICKVILKNDYWCKGLSFTQTTREMDRQLAMIAKYMEI